MDMDRLKNTIADCIDDIERKGVTNSNIETLYKLVDIYKDIMEVEKMDDSGYSGRRNRDSMGRYSRRYSADGATNESGNSYGPDRGGDYSQSYGRYIDRKQSYRNNKSQGNKDDMINAIEDFMGEIEDDLEEISRDSDCQEERETLMRYIHKLEKMIK